MTRSRRVQQRIQKGSKTEGNSLVVLNNNPVSPRKNSGFTEVEESADQQKYPQERK